LLDYCVKNNWAGYDPYDSLNSKLFKTIPILDRKYPRLILTQVLKRLPINLRPLLLVPKEQNPKGIALFISALINFRKLKFINDDALILNLIKRLIELRSTNQTYHCWGYNFDWQSRSVLLPKYHPNIIGTTFAGNTLLDAFETYNDSNYLEMAVSAAQFVIEDLNRTEDKDGICFSYTPYDHGQVHNANLLGAAYLSRVYSKTNENIFLELAKRAIEFTVNKQNDNGSWYYGEHKTQQWIDNFHTGYNLVALKRIFEYTKDNTLNDSIEKGYNFYLDNFFTNESLVKYYHNNLYPIDIHAIAYSIITLSEFKHLDEKSSTLVSQICEWAIKNMQNKRGYFYYQKKRFYTNRISYMRWSQAWMLYALSIFVEKRKTFEE